MRKRYSRIKYKPYKIQSLASISCFVAILSSTGCQLTDFVMSDSTQNKATYTKYDDSWITESEKLSAIGVSYKYGFNGFKKDQYNAINLLLRSASYGNAYAHYELGDTFYKGIGTHKDLQRALYHFKAAYKLNNNIVSEDFIRKVQKEYNAQNKISTKRVIAKANQESTKTTTSKQVSPKVYADQIVNEDNALQAIRPNIHNSDSLDTNNKSSEQLVLEGYMYLLAKNGYPHQPKKAYELFKQAADLSNGQAYIALASMTMNNTYGMFDHNKSIYYFEKASALGETSHFEMLASLYLIADIDGKPNKAKAIECLKKASKFDSTGQASLALGELFLNTVKSENDIKEAKQWFTKSCEQGNTKGCEASKKLSF